MLASAFWSTNDFTGTIDQTSRLDNFPTLFTDPVYRTVTIRTVVVAVLVTLIDLTLALPIAFFAAKVVQRRAFRYALVIALAMPLWASYLVKGYAWRVMLIPGGVVDWALKPLGLHDRAGPTSDHHRLAYLWLPSWSCRSMPRSNGCRSRCSRRPADLGASAGGRSLASSGRSSCRASSPARSSRSRCRSVTTSRSASSAARPRCSPTSSTTTSGRQQPAVRGRAAMVPIAVMVLYLFAVRRTGALENL